MIRSMTGFGRAECERGGRVLAAEMRTVNHRFLEVSLRLPRGLDRFEQEVRALFQTLLSRGKVHATVAWKTGSAEGVDLTVDWELAERTRAALEDLRRRLGLADPVTLAHLLSAPDLLVWKEPDLDPALAWEHLEETVRAAVADLVSMRESEGEALARDFGQRLDTLTAALVAVRGRSPQRALEAKTRLRERLQELLAGEAKVDEERLVLEAAILADRMDCTEECVRLESHLRQFRDLLTEGGAVGRKFNFLTQEMNREANTIGSKANDVTIAREVIAMKEGIEILREQVQNVE